MSIDKQFTFCDVVFYVPSGMPNEYSVLLKKDQTYAYLLFLHVKPRLLYDQAVLERMIQWRTMPDLFVHMLLEDFSSWVPDIVINFQSNDMAFPASIVTTQISGLRKFIQKMDEFFEGLKSPIKFEAIFNSKIDNHENYLLSLC